MTAENAKKIAEAFVKNDPNFGWEYVETRFVDARTAGISIECANKWVVEFKADQGEWNPATKLVVVDDQSGECLDWGC